MSVYEIRLNPDWKRQRQTDSAGIEHVEGENTAKIMQKATQEFELKNYSTRCKGIGIGKSFASQPFVVGGCPWTIQFYSDGFNEASHNSGYVSLYVRNESAKTVEFVYALHVLDQSGNCFHKGYSNFDDREYYRDVVTLEPGHMHGMSHFMRRAMIEYHSYLKGDCLRISAIIGLFIDFIDQPLVQVQPFDLCVFFKVGDRRFYAEESVLATRCPAFLSALPSYSVVFRDIYGYFDMFLEINSNVFEAILWYIYNGKLHKRDEDAISASSSFDRFSFAVRMQAAADQFNLNRLKPLCVPVGLCARILSGLKKSWRLWGSSPHKQQ